MPSIEMRLVLGLVLALAATAAEARLGVCGDRRLPPGRTREIRNLRLECTSAVDHYIRTPVPFDILEWRRAEARRERDVMQEIGRAQPEIRWNGHLLYQTIERWDWTENVHGKHPSCGYDTRTWRDSEGKEHTTEEMRSCWHDEDRSESRHCSTERMTYEAEFVRPPVSEWNPRSSGYYDVLPNKYDLLPGEVEDVQVFSNSGQGARVRPVVEIGDAWNKYRAESVLDGWGAEAPCRFGQRFNLRARVHTLERLHKATPNAFRMPVDRHGRTMEALGWQEGMTTKGDFVRSIPREIRLVDASEVLIAALARQSRKFEKEIEIAKDEAGRGRSTPVEGTRDFEKRAGFWQDTHVRIRLFKIERLARDVRVTRNLYVRGANASSQGSYKIPLVSGDSAADLYRASGPVTDSWWSGMRVGLEPGRPYELYVSMYQKGVPFYAQDCDEPENRNHWNCRLGLRTENHWFSKELPVPFVTEPMIEQRPAWQRLADFQGKPLWRKIYDLFR